MTALRDAQWHLVRRNAKVWGSVGYKNPILTEIYAELTLPGDGLGTSFVEIVPLLKPVGLNAVELSHIRNFNIETRNGDDPKVTKEHIPRLRVWNDNKSQLAQLSKNQIVINLVGKYAGWSAFRTLFDGVLGVVRNRKNVPISSIMLGTIDRATLPRSDFTAGKYLNASGDIIPKYFAKVSEPSDFIIGRGIVKNDGKNRQIQISWVPKGTHFEMVIQARFHNLLAATDKIEEVLEGLHVESNETFERIISDEMRLSVMGGSSAV